MHMPKVFPIVFAAICLHVLPASSRAQARPRLSADYLFKPGNIALTISAGGSAFTDFQQDPARVVATGSNLPPRTSGDYSRHISAQTTATAGAAVAVWLTSTFAVQLQGGYTPTRFRVTNEASGPDAEVIHSADSTRYARLDLWNVSGNLLFRPPVNFGRVSPYAILGAGAVRFQVRDDISMVPPEAQSRFTNNRRTQFLAVIGAGAVIPLQRKRLLLSFDITDHLTHTPLRDRSPTTSIETDGSEILIRPEGESEGPGGILMTSNVRLTVGLTIPLMLR